MQAFLANFTNSRRSEAIYAQGRDALLQARGEKEKFTAQIRGLSDELRELRAQSDMSIRMTDYATRSLVKTREERKSFKVETSKLREELEKEREAHAATKVRFKQELTQAKIQQSEAWETLAEERRAHEESILSEKAVFEATLEEERALRGAAESRIQALEEELKSERGNKQLVEHELNGVRARIRSAVADFKKSPAFESIIELRRQDWLANYHQSAGYRDEILQAMLTGANRALDRLRTLHPEWDFVEEIRREYPRPRQPPPQHPRRL